MPKTSSERSRASRLRKKRSAGALSASDQRWLARYDHDVLALDASERKALARLEKRVDSLAATKRELRRYQRLERRRTALASLPTGRRVSPKREAQTLMERIASWQRLDGPIEVEPYREAIGGRGGAWSATLYDEKRRGSLYFETAPRFPRPSGNLAKVSVQIETEEDAEPSWRSATPLMTDYGEMAVRLVASLEGIISDYKVVSILAWSVYVSAP